MIYDEIKPYIEKKLITENSHPENQDIKIFNYTPECQFTGEWDAVTMKCRGLIVNTTTNEILANPFPKFFNYGEKDIQLPVDDTPVITEKLDGSLGILYWVNEQPYIATRGSFTSEQAEWATRWFREQIGDNLKWFRDNTKGLTYLFEIIYKNNRIVVDYDFEGLVLIAIRDTATGVEYPLNYGEQTDEFRVVKEIKIDDWTSLAKENLKNAEGFVIYFPYSQLRLKIKFEEYKRLHKIMTGLSFKGVWESLKEKGINTKPEELVENVPDEFFEWLKNSVVALQTEYAHIEHAAQSVVDSIDASLPRKILAAEILAKSNTPSVCFAMLDNREYQHLIFKLIKPVSHTTYGQNHN